jgi:putative ABC transport system permease protein
LPSRRHRARPRTSQPQTFAEPLSGKVSTALLWRAMARVAVRMTFYDKLKAAGSIFGVVFALVLSNQNLALMSYLMHRNTMFVDNSGADLWIVPPATRILVGGRLLPMSDLLQAKVTRDVEWAAPVLWGSVLMKLPNGGSEQVTLIGALAPALHGGPWNLVAGRPTDLLLPNAIMFEDSRREIYGGLNLHDQRELNNHRVVAEGFTWGLVPFGPAYAFAEFNFARELLGVDSDQVSYVMIKLKPGANLAEAKRELQARVPEADVVTSDELRGTIRNFVLWDQGVGPMLGTSTVMGIIVALAIVSLTMLSAVLDNLREFGTLKAIGATTRDLMKILVVQSLLIAGIGSAVGVVIVSQMARMARAPNVMMPVSTRVLLGTISLLVVVCVLASGLALARLRKLEPAMVFR